MIGLNFILMLLMFGGLFIARQHDIYMDFSHTVAYTY